MGLLSAGIAHEIQNPLNFVINFSKMSDKLLKDLTEIVEDNEDKLSDDDREEVEDIVADLRENLNKIVEHGERAISIIQGILLVSRGKESEFLPTDICKVVKEYVWLSYHAMRANNKSFNISIHEQYEAGMPMMMVIPQDLSRVVLNVMNNACYAVWKRAQTAGPDYHPEVHCRQWRRYDRRSETTPLRELLHNETCRPRHRTGHGYYPRPYREQAWWHHRFRVYVRRRDDIHHYHTHKEMRKENENQIFLDNHHHLYIRPFCASSK